MEAKEPPVDLGHVHGLLACLACAAMHTLRLLPTLSCPAVCFAVWSSSCVPL